MPGMLGRREEEPIRQAAFPPGLGLGQRNLFSHKDVWKLIIVTSFISLDMACTETWFPGPYSLSWHPVSPTHEKCL